MRILFLTNNSVSQPLLEWLRDEAGEEVVLWDNKITAQTINERRPDYLISYSYRYLIRKDVIDLRRGRIINLHISFLPWNRGTDPNAWSFLEDSPKGVTIHQIDEGLDTGPILVQKEVEFDETRETLQSSYETLHREIQTLLIEHWDQIKHFGIEPKPQPSGGTKHLSKDFEPIKALFSKEGWGIPIPELKKRFRAWAEGKR
jgi:methionyl-tRNA formyltransferase